MSSLLLLKTRPQIVIPELAVRLGLNEALLLQQVQYWLSETSSGVDHEGHRWIYNTIEEWREQFPYFSESTIKRAFNNLKKLGVLNIEQINKRTHDRTNYYSINYEHALLSDEVKLNPSNSSAERVRTGQNDLIDKRKMKRSNNTKMTPSNGANCPDLTESTTENTQEITTESNSFCQAHAEPDYAQIVLDHFNKITNSSYQNKKTTMGYINERLAEGYSADELNQVSDYLTAKWLNDDEFSHNLRPMTVFGEKKFESYYQCSKRWHTEGRPVCINKKWVKQGEVVVTIDTVERDIVFTKLFSSHWKPESRIQAIAKELANKSGLGRKTEFDARNAWIGIWKQASEQAAKEVTV
ncbi:conserved phage C-terminal domain-containing protein [Providencia huaxiensis]|uniref:conserved phage C-terminal domain-containing protein n=1 Tax=Providencia huaxiensis TaxID=2027290 RepID=UPI0019D25265|nr:conserved phage C-terminal domain-containing protein [Providencia huaxiensis]MBN6363627.1 conserved phage C-terminal domain-containing protein [Providencia huaxiensis]